MVLRTWVKELLREIAFLTSSNPATTVQRNAFQTKVIGLSLRRLGGFHWPK